MYGFSSLSVSHQLWVGESAFKERSRDNCSSRKFRVLIYWKEAQLSLDKSKSDMFNQGLVDLVQLGLGLFGFGFCWGWDFAFGLPKFSWGLVQLNLGLVWFKIFKLVLILNNIKKYEILPQNMKSNLGKVYGGFEISCANFIWWSN